MSENSLPLTTRWLILTNNQIEVIPKSLGSCYRLQKLALAGNRIKELPIETVNCQNLELIRISANLLTEFPNWLLQLPKLSWVAFAGNPFSEMAQIPNQLNEINWADLNINVQLGQGASGIIYKSTLKGLEEEVAVKIFKGEITSDGLPLNEMNAAMAAGNHSNLVNVLGKIINHPEQKEGLVMSLIPENYNNLGNPPSLDSCSRDVFNVGTNFTINQILNIASGMASVCKQLHSLGINHGDLYAHNIMYHQDGNHLLGDFGAATFYDVNSTIAEALQKIEVRAYGCLLDDMLLNSTEDIQHPTIKLLTQLRDNCLQPNILKRPLFSEIMLFLESNTF
ncbi:MAG: protein kinase [Bacteroidia bacterium]|nr:protein kinase [Bacteroidia bacterium]